MAIPKFTSAKVAWAYDRSALKRQILAVILEKMENRNSPYALDMTERYVLRQIINAEIENLNKRVAKIRKTVRSRKVR